MHVCLVRFSVSGNSKFVFIFKSFWCVHTVSWLPATLLGSIITAHKFSTTKKNNTVTVNVWTTICDQWSTGHKSKTKCIIEIILIWLAENWLRNLTVTFALMPKLNLKLTSEKKQHSNEVQTQTWACTVFPGGTKWKWKNITWPGPQTISWQLIVYLYFEFLMRERATN